MAYVITQGNKDIYGAYIDEVDTLDEAEVIAELNAPATITEVEDDQDYWPYSDNDVDDWF